VPATAVPSPPEGRAAEPAAPSGSLADTGVDWLDDGAVGLDAAAPMDVDPPAQPEAPAPAAVPAAAPPARSDFADLPDDEIGNLIAGRRQKRQATAAMQERVRAEMGAAMNTGVRANPALAKAFNVVHPDDARIVYTMVESCSAEAAPLLDGVVTLEAVTMAEFPSDGDPLRDVLAAPGKFLISATQGGALLGFTLYTPVSCRALSPLARAPLTAGPRHPPHRASARS